MRVMELKIDLNRLRRAELRAFLHDLMAVGSELARTDLSLEQRIEIEQRQDDLSAWLAEKVVVSWPYKAPISRDGYKALKLDESMAVDEALTEALAWLSEQRTKKK